MTWRTLAQLAPRSERGQGAGAPGRRSAGAGLRAGSVA